MIGDELKSSNPLAESGVVASAFLDVCADVDALTDLVNGLLNDRLMGLPGHLARSNPYKNEFSYLALAISVLVLDHAASASDVARIIQRSVGYLEDADVLPQSAADEMAGEIWTDLVDNLGRHSHPE
ncbi:MAG: hypothetical protein JWM90_2362 [Thermoleophilia bacterium]|nr:hypothetical protein [Thermoleophilia bacterium]